MKKLTEDLVAGLDARLEELTSNASDDAIRTKLEHLNGACKAIATPKDDKRCGPGDRSAANATASRKPEVTPAPACAEPPTWGPASANLHQSGHFRRRITIRPGLKIECRGRTGESGLSPAIVYEAVLQIASDCARLWGCDRNEIRSRQSLSRALKC